MEKINIDLIAKKLVNEEVEIFQDKEIINALDESLIKLDKKYSKPLTCLGMIEDNGAVRDVLTIGNISTVIGGAKSKKTFFLTMLISSLLGSNRYAMQGNLFNLNVVNFDTEQATYHVHKIKRRVKKIIGRDELIMYALRKYSPDFRAALIEHYLKVNDGNYSFVLIDGIVDLLYDFNDLHESKKITTKLMEWSEKYKCHICCVLHTNKDKNYARGHLGAELMNKSETVIRVDKVDDFNSEVSCEVSRNMGFKSFTFNIQDGLPERLTFPNNFYNNDSSATIPEHITKYDKAPF